MQTWEAITSRRNVRSFADRPIPAADLDQILEAGRRSPSSQNWQPWDFIIVTDREQLRELANVWRGRAPRSLVGRQPVNDPCGQLLWRLARLPGPG